MDFDKSGAETVVQCKCVIWGDGELLVMCWRVLVLTTSVMGSLHFIRYKRFITLPTNVKVLCDTTGNNHPQHPSHCYFNKSRQFISYFKKNPKTSCERTDFFLLLQSTTRGQQRCIDLHLKTEKCLISGFSSCYFCYTGLFTSAQTVEDINLRQQGN